MKTISSLENQNFQGRERLSKLNKLIKRLESKKASLVGSLRGQQKHKAIEQTEYQKTIIEQVHLKIQTLKADIAKTNEVIQLNKEIEHERRMSEAKELLAKSKWSIKSYHMHSGIKMHLYQRLY